MRAGWWMGLAACLGSAACVPEPDGYYGTVQPAYNGYAQPGYVPPVYADPGYLVPDVGPRYVPPYGYPGPVAPGYGYGYGYAPRDRDLGFRDRGRREFQDRGERDRRFRDDQGPFRGRFEGNRVERPRPPEPPRQQPRPPPPGQTPPLPGGIFPGVPRPLPR